MKFFRLFGFPYFWIPVILGLDLITKAWAANLFGGVKVFISGWVTVRLIQNRGLAMGIGADGPLSPGALIVLFIAMALLLLFAALTPLTKRLRHWGFACMIGGALGNLGERLLRGYVTDFIEIWRFPIFNLADLALLVGMALAVVDIGREKQG